MQEHIRRAHPEHYIQKLPATEESFLLMISTDPSTRVQQQPQPSATSAPAGAFPSSQGFSPLIDRFQGFLHDRHAYDSSSPGTPRNVNHDEYGTPGSLLPAASAAAALAQLHGHKIEPEWESEIVSFLHPPCLTRTHRRHCRIGTRTPKGAVRLERPSSFPRSICPLTTSPASLSPP